MTKWLRNYFRSWRRGRSSKIGWLGGHYPRLERNLWVPHRDSVKDWSLSGPGHPSSRDSYNHSARTECRSGLKTKIQPNWCNPICHFIGQTLWKLKRNKRISESPKILQLSHSQQIDRQAKASLYGKEWKSLYRSYRQSKHWRTNSDSLILHNITHRVTIQFGHFLTLSYLS